MKETKGLKALNATDSLNNTANLSGINKTFDDAEKPQKATGKVAPTKDIEMAE